MKPIAIVGAGNGGCAMASHLTLQGLQVHLCEIYSSQRIVDLKKRGGIEFTGAAGEGFAVPKLMTTDIEEAIKNVDLVFWTIPANGHEFHVRQFAPYLKSNQILLLTPGAVGGALCVTNSLKQMKVSNVHVGETCTLPYGCRLTSPFRVWIHDIAKDVLFAMFPDNETHRVLELLKPILPNLIVGDTVLDTSLNYINLLLHPVGMILNVGWIEHRKGDFDYYYDAISPSVAKILEEMDKERLRIIQALSLKPVTFVEWFFRRGRTETKESVYEAIHSSLTNRNFHAPESLNHRFMYEDVPFALVPLSHLGRLLKMATPVTDALILLASRMCGRDFIIEGNNLQKMGISELSPHQLKRWVSEGRLS